MKLEDFQSILQFTYHKFIRSPITETWRRCWSRASSLYTLQPWVVEKLQEKDVKNDFKTAYNEMSNQEN